MAAIIRRSPSNLNNLDPVQNLAGSTFRATALTPKGWPTATTSKGMVDLYNQGYFAAAPKMSYLESAQIARNAIIALGWETKYKNSTLMGGAGTNYTVAPKIPYIFSDWQYALPKIGGLNKSFSNKSTYTPGIKYTGR